MLLQYLRRRAVQTYWLRSQLAESLFHISVLERVLKRVGQFIDHRFGRILGRVERMPYRHFKPL